MAKSAWTVKRVPLNRGGYDKYGDYYGVGAPLYRCENEETGESGEVRAHTAAEARAICCDKKVARNLV